MYTVKLYWLRLRWCERRPYGAARAAIRFLFVLSVLFVVQLAV